MTPPRPPSSSGLSFVEVLLALSVVAVAGLSVMGLLSSSIQQTSGIQTDYQTALVLQNVRARWILDPDFPVRGPLTTEIRLHSDRSGQIVPEEDAVFELSFRPAAPLHWPGHHLEAVRVEIGTFQSQERFSVVLQRASARGRNVP